MATEATGIDRPLLVDDFLQRRRYQLQLADAAADEHTRLSPDRSRQDDGQPARHRRAPPRSRREGALFSPHKTLVQQHADFYREALSIPDDEIVVFTGDVKPDDRAALWNDARIVIATPQVVENDLVGNRISLRDVTHCTFDECHRATGDYAYVYIAERYHADAADPLVTGMSASPGGDTEEIETVCENLGLSNVEVMTEEGRRRRRVHPRHRRAVGAGHAPRRGHRDPRRPQRGDNRPTGEAEVARRDEQDKPRPLPARPQRDAREAEEDDGQRPVGRVQRDVHPRRGDEAPACDRAGRDPVGRIRSSLLRAPARGRALLRCLEGEPADGRGPQSARGDAEGRGVRRAPPEVLEGPHPAGGDARDQRGRACHSVHRVPRRHRGGARGVPLDELRRAEVRRTGRQGGLRRNEPESSRRRSTSSKPGTSRYSSPRASPRRGSTSQRSISSVSTSRSRPRSARSSARAGPAGRPRGKSSS